MSKGNGEAKGPLTLGLDDERTGHGRRSDDEDDGGISWKAIAGWAAVSLFALTVFVYKQDTAEIKTRITTNEATIRMLVTNDAVRTERDKERERKQDAFQEQILSILQNQAADATKRRQR